LSNERNDLGPHDAREKLSLQERKLLEHHETELCSPSHRFGPTVRIKLGENGGDVKLSGVEGDSQPTCDGFVGDAVCHRELNLRAAAVRGFGALPDRPKKSR
jgi:hypothetical protein